MYTDRTALRCIFYHDSSHEVAVHSVVGKKNRTDWLYHYDYKFVLRYEMLLSGEYYTILVVWWLTNMYISSFNNFLSEGIIKFSNVLILLVKGCPLCFSGNKIRLL